MPTTEQIKAKTESLKHPGLAVALFFPGLTILIFALTNIFTTGYFEHVSYQSTQAEVKVVSIEKPQSKCPSQKRVPAEPVVVRASNGDENYYCTTAGRYRVGDKLDLYLTDAGRAYDFSSKEPTAFLGFMGLLFLVIWIGGDRLMAKEDTPNSALDTLRRLVAESGQG